jgi:glycosyltransferase involved in cell wall biosynthesis
MAIKKILLVYDRMGLGGIETMIVRIANWCIDNNIQVNLIVKKNNDIAKLLSHRVNIIVLSKYYSYLYIPYIAKKTLNQHSLQDSDIAMSFNPKSNWMLSNILQSLSIQCLHITGIYHPRSYIRSGLHLSEKIIGKKLLQKNQNNIIFMNDECKQSHSKYLNIDFNTSKIIPIPVNIPNSNNTKNYIKNNKFTMVSIGRLAAFKTYNLYMIDVIKQLRKNNYNVYYHIYGSGELGDKIQNKIDKHNLNNYVSLKGDLKYDNFNITVRQYDLFIGMGTAAIEAGLCKIPVIVPIENNIHKKTYGYLNDLPPYNVGEKNSELIAQNIDRIIEKTINFNETEYQKLCENIHHYAKQNYSINNIMKKIITPNIAPHTPYKITIFDRIAYFILELIHPITKLKFYK